MSSVNANAGSSKVPYNPTIDFVALAEEFKKYISFIPKFQEPFKSHLNVTIVPFFIFIYLSMLKGKRLDIAHRFISRFYVRLLLIDGLTPHINDLVQFKTINEARNHHYFQRFCKVGYRLVIPARSLILLKSSLQVKRCSTLLFLLENLVADEPSKPGRPEPTDLDVDHVDLQWAPPASDGGAPVTKYIVGKKKKGAHNWHKAKEIPGDKCAATVGDLEEGEEYEFRVIAVNKRGKSEPSDSSRPVIAKPKNLAPKIDRKNLNPLTVRSLQAVKLDINVKGEPTPTITWTIDGKPLPDSARIKPQIEPYHTMFVITKALHKDTNKYTITAKNSNGTDEAVLELKVLGKPSKPKGPLEVADVHAEGCKLSWDPPEDDGGEPVQQYVVEKMDTETGRWVPVLTTKDPEAEITGLIPGKDYKFRVKAVNPEGESEPLETEKATTAKNPFGEDQNISNCSLKRKRSGNQWVEMPETSSSLRNTDVKTNKYSVEMLHCTMNYGGLEVVCADIDHQNHRFACGFENSTICVGTFDMEIIRPLICLKNEALHRSSPSNVSGTPEHTFTTDFGLNHCLTGHSDVITGLTFAPSGGLMSCSDDTTARFWRRSDLKNTRVYRDHRGQIKDIAVSDNEIYFATASIDCTAHLWSFERSTALINFRHSYEVQRLRFDPNCRYLATLSARRTIQLWTVEDGRSVWTIPELDSSYLNCITISPDGKHIAYADDNGCIKVWDLSSRQLYSKGAAHKGPIYDLAYNDDNSVIGSCGADRLIKVWNAKKLAPEEPVPKKRDVWMHEELAKYYAASFNPCFLFFRKRGNFLTTINSPLRSESS